MLKVLPQLLIGCHHLLLSDPLLYLITLPVEVVQLLAFYQSVVSPW